VTFTEAGADSQMTSPIAEMTQRNKTFVPDVLAIGTGESVQFPNADPVLHHVYSFSPAKAFELDLYSRDALPTVEFDSPGVVTIGCNIHDEMRGYIYVTSENRFGTSDSGGNAHFSGVASGEYAIKVWHSRLRTDSEMNVTVSIDNDESKSATVALDLRRDLTGEIDAYERGGYE
jgi:plastocyanin